MAGNRPPGADARLRQNLWKIEREKMRLPEPDAGGYYFNGFGRLLPGKGGCMYRRFFYSILVIGMMLLAAFAAEADEPQRRVVATRLVAEGIDPEQAQTLLRDPRVTVRPEIVLKNLFYSKPRPSRQRPEVMEVDPRQIARGRSFIATHAMMLDAARKRFGVSPRIITAILIVESWLGDYPMPYGVFNAYANLAFLLDPDYLKNLQERYAAQYPQLKDEATLARAKTKAVWAAGEMVFLLHLANHLDADPLTFKGSFAGAMGPGQFIPSSFWIFGIDGDEDGLASPFNMGDATLSMANYLYRYGWREDAPLEQKRKALWYYNRSAVYVNTVLMVYEELEK